MALVICSVDAGERLLKSTLKVVSAHSDGLSENLITRNSSASRPTLSRSALPE